MKTAQPMPFSIGEKTRDWAMTRSIPVVYFARTNSTNDLAKEDFAELRGPFAETSPPLALYLAEAQNHGRGRHGGKWLQARPGDSLLATWSFGMAAAPQPIFSPLVGLALFDALGSVFTGAPLSLKAPNDIYLGERKLAGVLIETVETGESRRAAVGLGINVFSAPEATDETGPFSAISLVEGGARVDAAAWSGFLNALKPRLERAAVDGCKSELGARDRASLLNALNKNPALKAPILDVDSAGQLVTSSGLTRWQDL